MLLFFLILICNRGNISLVSARKQIHLIDNRQILSVFCNILKHIVMSIAPFVKPIECIEEIDVVHVFAQRVYSLHFQLSKTNQN